MEGECLMRRRADDWINATHILKVAGFDKPSRTRILEREVQKGVHEKVQGGYGKYQGTWIPLPEARLLAERNNILDKIRPILDYVAGDRSPPPAPKHTTASRPRAPRGSTANKRAVQEESFNMRAPRMSVPSFSQDQYDMPPPTFEEEESIEHTTLESSSMMAEEDMVPMSQHSNHSRKRKRTTGEVNVMSTTEQEHILYGDQLLDYFMTVGDAPEAAKVQPPVPPANFQVDRPIDDQGNTALHWAAAMGDLEIVQDLLRRGANVHAVSVHEETPLVRAVLFTNNYEKKTMPALVNLLQENLTFRDWFGATVFHHLAETTRSKGKWKSARYYCEVLLQKIRDTFPPQELDMLLSCQDSNGDTPALVAARNGNFRLTSLFLLHCRRAGDLVNQKGDTAVGIMDQANARRVAPPPPSSVTYVNERADIETLDVMDTDDKSLNPPPASSPAASVVARKISRLMEEAQRKLSLAYGNAKVGQQSAGDVTSPQELFEQLEKDRQALQKEMAALMSQEGANDSLALQMDRYKELESRCASLIEQIHRKQLSDRFDAGAPKEQAPPSHSDPPDTQELLQRYELVRRLVSAQEARREAVRELLQQKADAGVSTKLDMHRKLVALATGLKEDELDPMAAELADTLEFDRINGKESEDVSSARLPFPSHAMHSGSTVPVDA
ncbi:APSES transcription factor, putative [Talaromyces stipitatus ATCC 10500]|uniref:Cell pattern formation-associated protein stuA n=1 Tax=Talaromyces stipitatus (strain ATCC 10500 / CBS 375.48 / QM 6759 / NRRL 1006) TaxID=441959 RepID=B8M4X5_TALSN|nr:APSES transcription factor, putative [Talaromyces stipitatus ATCC 10500]EED19410.1 APSES transcription factor, putative [Talaromyces stipitatus ATCC 10500]